MIQEISDSQAFQYVLVFNNPYSKSNPILIKKFLKKIATEKAERKFKNCFRLDDTDPNFYNALQDLKASLTGKNDIKVEKLAQKIFELAILVIQRNLGIEIKATLINDNKEIALSLKATDENLQVQAELIRYKIKLLNSEDDFPFKQYPPYGDFTRKAYEAKLYNETNGNVFTYADKVRLLYSMLTSIIELSEFESLQLLSSQFPLHTDELEKFSKNWVSFSRIFKAQDIDSINNYYGEKIAMYFA